jgi:hypothetical protein
MVKNPASAVSAAHSQARVMQEVAQAKKRFLAHQNDQEQRITFGAANKKSKGHFSAGTSGTPPHDTPFSLPAPPPLRPSLPLGNPVPHA